MTRPTLYLTTCGTSLPGNQAGSDHKRLNDTANLEDNAFPKEERAFIGELAERARTAMRSQGDTSAKQVSAELASILTCLAELGVPSVQYTPDHHLVIVTEFQRA